MCSSCCRIKEDQSIDSTDINFPRIEADEVTRVATVELTFICKDKPLTI